MIQTFKEFITEAEKINFSNWVKPDDAAIKLEYQLEVVNKGMEYLFDGFPDFMKKVKQGKTMVVTPAIDRKISYRSHTRNYDALLSLIKSYRSYPEFRNEGTLQAIYDGFRNNAKMKMPMVLQFPSGRYRVLGGNTRMDIAMHLGINPKVIIVPTNSEL